MIITKQLDDRRTFTYSDKNKWIRQIETGNEYETAIDYIHYTYEEMDKDIEDSLIDSDTALDILIGGVT